MKESSITSLDLQRPAFARAPELVSISLGMVGKRRRYSHRDAHHRIGRALASPSSRP